MRNKLVICGFAALLCSTIYSAELHSAEVEVKWQQPEKFTDIQPANDNRKVYRERVMKKFDEFFQQLAAKLPEGYSWQVTVTDIDLAGDVDYFAGGAGNALRIVKDLYSPSIKFNHVLRDNFGEELLNEEEKLRDLGFMQTIGQNTNSNDFHYEQTMLQNWFNKVLLPKVEQHNAALPKVSQ